MKALADARFEVDHSKLTALLDAGDLHAVEKYLEPAKRDELRGGNYFLFKINAPAGVKPDDIIVTAGDHNYFTLSKGGLSLRLLPETNTTQNLQIFAPGCKGFVGSVKLSGKPIDAREFTLARLTPKDAATFTGRVLGPDGKPAPNAIVRVCDWTWTRANADGTFRITGLSPGEFLVRGEAPGGEFHNTLTFKEGAETKQDIALDPITTVGIRWTLQTREGERILTGEGVKNGEAYFSLKHSRFVLDRGAESRIYWGSDFMLREWDAKTLRPHTAAKYADEADAAAPGTPIFFLFDAGERQTGLHLENKPFNEITEASHGAATGERHYEFLRGKPVHKGDTYTVWCLQKNCYAKIEVTDLTIVPTKTARAK
jgi:hypothetical protein